MFPTRSNRAAPESCLLFLLPLGDSGSFVIPRYTFVISKGFGPEPVSKAEDRVQEGGRAALPPRKAEFQNVESAALPPAKTRPDVEERPVRAASKSHEAGLQPRRESFQNVVATVNRNVFSGSFNT